MTEKNKSGLIQDNELEQNHSLSKITPPRQFIIYHFGKIKRSYKDSSAIFNNRTRVYAKSLIITVWIFFSGVLALLRARPPLNPATPIDLDASWMLGLPAAMEQGVFSGRDFFFTYGPLWQLIEVAASHFDINRSVFANWSWLSLFPTLLNIGLTGLLMSLINPIKWKFTLLVLAILSVLNFNSEQLSLRALLGLFAAVMLARVMAVSTPKKRLAGAAALGLVCFTTQLVTLELGVYTALTAVIVLALYGGLSFFRPYNLKLELLESKAYFQMLAGVIASFVAANLSICFLFLVSSSNYTSFLDYQTFGLESIRGYLYTMGEPWHWNIISTLVLALVIIYSIVFIIFNLKELETRDGYLLVGIGVCALFQLKGATVRSDEGHIMLSAIPLIFLFLIIGNNWLKREGVRFGWGIILVALISIWPSANLSYFNQLSLWADGDLSISNKIKEITTVQTDDAAFVPVGLKEALDFNKAVLVFPNDNYLDVALGKKWLAPVFQSYAAHTEPLQNKYVEQIEKQKNSLEIIYGIDGRKADTLGGVQQVTRSPIIFDYIYRNFQLKTPNTFANDGYFVLEPRSKQISLEGELLPMYNSQPEKQAGPGTVYRLNKAAECNMLRFKTRINYPVTTLIGRPSPVTLKFFLGPNLVHLSNVVAIEPSKEFTTFVSLDLSNFQNIFSSSAPVARKQWDAVQWSSFDQTFLSIAPSSVSIGEMNCITFKR